MMRTCRKWVMSLELSMEEPKIHKYIGFLDTNLVMRVHQKAAKERVPFNDVNACGSDFVKMIASAYANKIDMQKLPYPIIHEEPPSKRSSKQSGSSSRSLMEFKEGKLNPAQLAKMGFTVSSLVKRKGASDDETYNIKDIQSDNVVLEKVGATEGDRRDGRRQER